jgi:hypothetical protein
LKPDDQITILGFKFFTLILLAIKVFLHTLCRLVNSYQCFGGACFLLLQGIYVLRPVACSLKYPASLRIPEDMNVQAQPCRKPKSDAYPLLSCHNNTKYGCIDTCLFPPDSLTTVQHEEILTLRIKF